METIVFVGDHWDRQNAFGSWGLEIPKATAGLNVIDLVGATMVEVRKRVEELPDRAAPLSIPQYIPMEREPTFHRPTGWTRCGESKSTNRGCGGDVVLAPGGVRAVPYSFPTEWREAGRLALRILHGEPASISPATTSHAVKPIFNWLEMQRWGARRVRLCLPAAKFDFANPGVWEKYRWQTLSVAAVLLMQTGLISILLHERHRRGNAERESQSPGRALAHANRQATAGELTSTIAHELNQPLGAILTNTETAELILNSPSPDLSEVKDILADIRRDDIRAGEIIHHMRCFLRRARRLRTRLVELNDTVRKVFDFLSAQASARNVALHFEPSGEPIRVRGDQVQLQQVIVDTWS